MSKNLRYDAKKTVAKGAIEGGSVGGIGLLLAMILNFFRAQEKVPWDATMDPEIVIGVTAVLAWAWKMFRNWRKNR